MGLFDSTPAVAAKVLEQVEIAVVPVISERLTVHKTMADAGGIRVHKQVRTEHVTLQEPLLRQSVEVTRTPIGREIDAPLPIRYEGDETIIPVVQERLVLRRQLFLVEEVRMKRVDLTIHEPQEVTLRHESVTVERQDMASGNWRPEAATVGAAARGAATAGGTIAGAAAVGPATAGGTAVGAATAGATGSSIGAASSFDGSRVEPGQEPSRSPAS